MTAPSLPSYAGFAGKRLALVETMLHSAFYDGIHRAMAHGAEIWLLIRDREWYGSERDWRDHPLARVDRLLMVDTHDADAVTAALTDASGGPLVDGVTTFSDYHTEVSAEVAARLGLPGPSRDAIRAANQKHLLRELTRGQPYTVPHRLVTSAAELPAAADELGFPMVAKPPAEAISYGVRLVSSYAELATTYAELSGIRRSLRGQPRPGHVLLERFVAGVEVSVESLTVAGTTGFYGVTSKALLPPPSFLERAHSFPVALDPADTAELYATVTDVLTRIGYTQGPCHTELKLTPDGPKLIEVNPRLPAHCITTMVTDVCERNPHLDAKLLALGVVPEPLTFEQRGGAAVVVVYPDRSGVLTSVDGVADAAAVPGVTGVLLHASPGDELWHRIDNSASVGFVYARGTSADDALTAAEKAAELLTVRTVEEGV